MKSKKNILSILLFCSSIMYGKGELFIENDTGERMSVVIGNQESIIGHNNRFLVGPINQGQVEIFVKKVGLFSFFTKKSLFSWIKDAQASYVNNCRGPQYPRCSQDAVISVGKLFSVELYWENSSGKVLKKLRMDETFKSAEHYEKVNKLKNYVLEGTFIETYDYISNNMKFFSQYFTKKQMKDIIKVAGGNDLNSKKIMVAFISKKAH